MNDPKTDLAFPGREPKTHLELHFEGRSDDTFGEYHEFNADVDNGGTGDPIVFRLDYVPAPGFEPTEKPGPGLESLLFTQSLLVVGRFGHGSGWSIGVACADTKDGADVPLPDWPIRVERSERSYSPRLVITAPVGVLISRVG